MRNIFIGLVLAFGLQLSTTYAQGTAFSYQGQLMDGGSPANGIGYGMVFYLYDAPTNGNVLGNEGIVSVTVSNGLFTVPLDFGNVFDGKPRWLEIAVQKNGSSFTTLAPRQQLTPTPYSIFANTASNVSGTISASQLSGSVPLARLPAGIITNGSSGVNVTGTFNGNGAGMTNVSVSSLIPPTNSSTAIIGWGYNATGQLNIPAGLSNVMAVAAGEYHSLALKNDGTVIGWGDNLYGELNIPAGLSNVVAVAAGAYHSLALKNDGTVVGWGDNLYGELNIPAGLSNVVAVAAGELFGLAMKNDGTIVGWGDNNFGETNTPAGLSNVVAMAAGALHGLALKSDGTVAAWGYNNDGETSVPAGLSNVMAVTAGNGHSLALKNDGTVVAWGANYYGETNIPAGLSNVVAVVAGGYHSLALKSDGTIIAWGDNNYGELNFPPGLNGVIALAPGSLATTVLAIQKRFASSLVPLLNADNTFNGNILVNGIVSGNGSGLTLDADNLASGTVPAARLPAAVVMDHEAGVTLIGTFSGSANLSGTFEGNGTGLTSLNPNVALLNANQTFTGVLAATKWKATTIINQAGPLPVGSANNLTTSGGTLMISASGTGYSTTSGLIIGMDIKLDGVVVDSCLVYLNIANNHTVFMPKTFVKTGVAAGPHTLTLVAHTVNMTTDAQDTFCVTVQELPF